MCIYIYTYICTYICTYIYTYICWKHYDYKSQDQHKLIYVLVFRNMKCGYIRRCLCCTFSFPFSVASNLLIKLLKQAHHLVYLCPGR